MPRYRYQCQFCASEFDWDAKMQDPPPAQGPGCTKGECQLEKKLQGCFAQVRGKFQEPARPAPPPIKESASHVCSKYCDLHKN